MRHLKFIAAALLMLGCTPKEEITCYTDYVDPKYCDGRDRLVITKGRHMKGRISHGDLVSGSKTLQRASF